MVNSPDTRSARRGLQALLTAAAGLALLALGACSSYSAPKVENVGVSAPSTGASGATAVVFDLNVRNDNDEGLPLRVVDYTLEIDGKRVFAGTRSAEATAPAKGVQRVRLPAAFEGSELRPGARYRLSGSFTYVIPGAFAEALFDSGVRVPSASFAAEGEIAQ